MKRFWDKVRKTDQCWEWTSATTSAGYGAFYLNGQSSLAHRFSYEDAKGSVPKGLELDHLCQNKVCVNPDHLEPVTHQENIRRGMLTKRSKVCRKCGADLTNPNNLYKPFGANGRRCKQCLKDAVNQRYLTSKLKKGEL